MTLRNWNGWNRNQTPAYRVSDGDTEFDGVLLNPDDEFASVEIVMDSVDADMTFYIAGLNTADNWVRFDDTQTVYTASGGDVAQIRVKDLPLEQLRLEVVVGAATTGTLDKINWVIK